LVVARLAASSLQARFTDRKALNKRPKYLGFQKRALEVQIFFSPLSRQLRNPVHFVPHDQDFGSSLEKDKWVKGLRCVSRDDA
jgi:hypothetical protein